MSKFLYEVALYKIYKNRAESIGNKFYILSKPFKGKMCIYKRIDSNCILMKTITEYGYN